jgi:hypothetical protein
LSMIAIPSKTFPTGSKARDFAWFSSKNVLSTIRDLIYNIQKMVSLMQYLQ